MSKIEAVFPRLVELRRTLHEYPELAFKEERTAQVIIEELTRLGVDHEYEGVGSAVIGRLQANGPGLPTIALRAEMDGLPANEHTGLPFASKIPGQMHACGHDAHMAMVLGSAALLVDDPPDGNVVFVFQPAEERGGGARVAMESGALDGVDAVFAGHVTHHYKVGEIMVASGVVTAQSDRFVIRIKGRGGHGARPHEAIDAVVIAGMFITAIQTLVSRETDPVHPSVITIGRVEAGTAGNVIADEAMLDGTIRTTFAGTREHIHQGLQRLGRALSVMHGAQIEVEIRHGYPPVINTRREADIARRAATLVVGTSGIVEQEHPSMGSEDFGFLMQRFPGCYVRYGARIEEKGYIPLHSPQFDIDEDVLRVGAAFLEQVTREAIHDYAHEVPD